MDDVHFDHLTRRLVLGGFAAALGLGIPRRPDGTSARKRRRKLNLNEFGCVNVGGKCGGRDSNCCSGLCQGKKPKQGKPDRSRCVAHDEGGCEAGLHPGGCGGSTVLCTTSVGKQGHCMTTTGNAGYCQASGLHCTPCQKDADCRSLCGAAAACVRCPPGCGGTDTVCVAPEECN